VAKYVKTPPAAWILVTLMLLAYVQQKRDNIICDISDLTLDANKGKKRNKPYPRRIMIFCLTLAGYSVKAYKFLQGAALNCLPTIRTLRTYRKRVDSSPGFSTSAFNMIQRKVKEMADQGKKLFISISCDDMSISRVGHPFMNGNERTVEKNERN